MREGSGQSVDPNDDQRVSLADTVQDAREDGAGAIASGAVLLANDGAACGFESLGLRQQCLIVGRDACRVALKCGMEKSNKSMGRLCY